MKLPRIVLAVALVLLSCAAAIAASISHADAPQKVRAPRDPCLSLPTKWQRAQCESYTTSAPGDEYFGPLKISYLGIDNTAHDVAIESGTYTTNTGLISRIKFADLALRDWERKYPRDPQLPRSYYLMIRALSKIYTQSAQQEAWAYMQHVIRAFPGSYFAKTLRLAMARGFTEHWFAVPQPCPTPARNQIGELTPIATPIPTPLPRRGQPKVDLMTPPCVSVIIPTPEATARSMRTPIATPTPTETPTPTPSPS